MWIIELSTQSIIFIDDGEYASIDWNKSELFIQVVDHQRQAHLINPNFIAQIFQAPEEVQLKN